jgi:hypothetical protein
MCSTHTHAHVHKLFGAIIHAANISHVKFCVRDVSVVIVHDRCLHMAWAHVCLAATLLPRIHVSNARQGAKWCARLRVCLLLHRDASAQPDLETMQTSRSRRHHRSVTDMYEGGQMLTSRFTVVSISVPPIFSCINSALS